MANSKRKEGGKVGEERDEEGGRAERGEVMDMVGVLKARDREDEKIS